MSYRLHYSSTVRLKNSELLFLASEVFQSHSMSNKQYEDVPFLAREASSSEEDGLPRESCYRPRRNCYLHKANSTFIISLILAFVLVMTVLAVQTQKISTNSKADYPASDQHALQDADLPLDAPLIPSEINPDLYAFPRLGNVVLKTPGCGNSPEEAKALGCIFDPMNWHWTRPECFYKEGSDYSQTKGPWSYYQDLNYTEPLYLPDKQSMSTTRIMYTEHAWHVEHCVYALKSLHRAAMMGKWIPEEAASWPHSLHCMKVFEMMGTPPETLNTRVDMQFLACVKFELGPA